VDERATGTKVRTGGLGAGLIAVCLWGLAPVATRSLVSELAPLPLLTVRQLLAAGVLLPWAVPALRRIDARDLPRLITAGLLGMVGYNLPVTVGLQRLPASSAGLLVLQRAFQPIYRAAIDGRPAHLRIANLHRIAVDVPAGRHRVDLWVDRRPLWFSFGGSTLGGAGLALLGRRRQPSRNPIRDVSSAPG